MRTRSTFLAAALGLACLGAPQAAAAGAAECDAKYLFRADSPERALDAAECYLALSPADESSAERASIALTWAIRRGTVKADRAAAVALGSAAADAWTKAGLAGAPYWRSVFRTFDANLRDEGLRLPIALLRALPDIRKDLREAAKTRPETHGYGPARVQGVIDLSAPAIAGGDPERALAHFRDALDGSPKSSLNQLWFAKGLIRLRRESEGVAVLRELVARDPSAVDAMERAEFMEDRAEAAKILEAFP